MTNTTCPTCKQSKTATAYRTKSNGTPCKICRECAQKRRARTACEHGRAKNSCRVCQPNTFLTARIRSRANFIAGITTKEVRAALGIDVNRYRLWLEKQFTEGMTWANYGTVWEIDHIVPLGTAIGRAAQISALHYTNTRPLGRTENRARGLYDEVKTPTPTQTSQPSDEVKTPAQTPTHPAPPTAPVCSPKETALTPHNMNSDLNAQYDAMIKRQRVRLATKPKPSYPAPVRTKGTLIKGRLSCVDGYKKLSLVVSDRLSKEALLAIDAKHPEHKSPLWVPEEKSADWTPEAGMPIHAKVSVPQWRHDRLDDYDALSGSQVELYVQDQTYDNEKFGRGYYLALRSDVRQVS